MLRIITSKLIQLVYSIFIGFVIGLTVNILISKNLYLDMRIKSYVPMIICIAIAIFSSFLLEKKTKGIIFFSVEFILFFIILIFKNFDLAIYIFKDTLLGIYDYDEIKIIFIILFIFMNIMSIFFYFFGERGVLELTKRKKGRIIVIVLILLCVIIYFTSSFVRNNINDMVAILSQLDTKKVIEYIRSYGKMAAVVSFFLMILQSVAAPIPAFLITLSNASIFGWVNGAILSWSSAMVGASICFYIARFLGRDFVEKLTSKGAMESVDVFFERYGKHTILICRLLPFVSFDFVSYAAGLTNMSFWSFFVATGIGQLPATIVYSYVGGTLTGGAQKLFIGLLILFALSIMIAMFKKIYNEKHQK